MPGSEDSESTMRGAAVASDDDRTASSGLGSRFSYASDGVSEDFGAFPAVAEREAEVLGDEPEGEYGAGKRFSDGALESDFDSESESESESGESSLSSSSGMNLMPSLGFAQLKRVLVVFWHFLPLILLGIWSMYSVWFGGPASNLSSSEIAGYDADESVIVLKNHTLIHANGTLMFYNGTLRFPNGTFFHRRSVLYDDLAECSAQRVSSEQLRALKSYLLEEKEEEAGDLPEVVDLERESSTIPFCGFESKESFKSWSGLTKSKAPVFFPKTEEEVQDLVRSIGDAGCKVRPIGASQSESGITIDPLEDNLIGLSLAKFRASSESGWAPDPEATLEKGLIRVEAGRTLMEVSSLIRPFGFHLPTVPTLWSMTIGGAVCGMSSGIVFGKSYLSAYVSMLRVILADGSVAEISDQIELAMWRNSMGLLGLIIGVEMKVESHDFFSMGARKTIFEQWNPWSVDQIMTNLLPGANGAEFLLDPWTDEMVGVGYTTTNPFKSSFLFGSNKGHFVSNSACSFDVTKMECKHPEMCVYKPTFGDVIPSQMCKLKRQPNPSQEQLRSNYASFCSVFEESSQRGLPLSRDTDFHLKRDRQSVRSVGQMAYWTETVLNSVNEAREKFNDGFWRISYPSTTVLAYFFPVKHLFRALDVYRSLVRELIINDAPYQFRDSPVAVHFVRVDKNSQVLQPGGLVSGNFACVEVRVGASSAQKDLSSWRVALMELEKRWRVILGEDAIVFPALGGAHAFHVFSSRNSTEDEELEAKYRRVKRVRDAFQRVKSHLERLRGSNEGKRGGTFSFFSSSHDAYYDSLHEEQFMIDPSIEMFDDLQAEIQSALSEAEFNAITRKHENAMARTSSGQEYFGDLKRELLQKAFLKSLSEGDYDSSPIPVPFMNPEILHETFDEKQLVAFLRYRRSVDPESRFWGGTATRYFPIDMKNGDPASISDPDALAEAQLILDIIQTSKYALSQKDFKRNLFGKIVLAGMTGFALYRMGFQLCQNLFKKRRRRRRRRSSSS